MYPTDLTDAQWEKLEPLLTARPPQRHPGGRPRKHELRRIVDALLYVVKTGCPWRSLPRDFPPWRSVYEQFRRWRDDGTWVRVQSALREELRQARGRKPVPTVALIDSQSVKTSSKGQRGYDAGKKVKGRKRHLATDSEGFPLALVVHSAGIQDRRGARTLLARLAARFRSIQTVFADGGYQGEKLQTWVKAMFGYRLEIVKRHDTPALRDPPQTLDRRAKLRLAQSLPTPFQGLRGETPIFRSHDPHRLHLPHAKTSSI